ncbi:MAG: dihydropteroate synthase [Actinobacteria bacterium]|nr:dihydropteroate synthase [Actinomycetota bacterium]
MKYGIRALNIKSREEGLAEFGKIGSTAAGSNIMLNKLFPAAIKVKNLRSPAINILKQEMLARGGDVVTSRDVLLDPEGRSDVIILGTRRSFEGLVEKIKMQQFGLNQLSLELSTFIKSMEAFPARPEVSISTRTFNTGEQAIIMGILNVTPDSFYDGGNYDRKEKAFKRIEELINEGAHIIDVGGMSSRPGSVPVSIKEEIDRVIPVIKYISTNHDVLISVDTYRPEVARLAAGAGAHIVNDISSFSMDPRMLETVLETGVSVVLMHMKGTPENMQDSPVYENVVEEISGYLRERINLAVSAGIKRDRIIIDPGIGFGKTCGHNLNILNKISEFRMLGCPVMVGASRKSFIGAVLGLPADQRLEGSLAAAVWAIINGADILRVHDVGETIRAVKLVKSIMKGY